MTMFEVTARLKIRAGELDGFKRRAADIMRLARQLDTKTLRYDWFVSEDGTECEVREGYLDADGLFEHNAHVRESRDSLFRDYADDHDMTIYGEPSPALVELMERMATHVVFNRFSLLEGLDSGTEGGTTTMFEASALLKIREGKLEGFKEHVADVVRLMSEQDEQPFRYDWFLNADGPECEVREAYADADTLLRHQQAIAEAKMKLFREFVESHTMTFYSEPSPALVGALKAMGTQYKVFSFLQGLHAGVDVREEVHA